MSFITFLLCVLINSALSSAAPKLQNITISVPEGTKNHGDPNMLCFPTKAWDVVAFFLGNYVAHIATTITQPGELPLESSYKRLTILFTPFSGILSGVQCIYNAAYFQKTPLQVALKSSALCEVLRNQNWRPQDGDIIRNLKVSQDFEELLSKSFNPRTQYEENRETREGKLERQQCQPPTLRAEIRRSDMEYSIYQPNKKWGFGSRQVYGICKLPEGYSLTPFPPESEVGLCTVPGDGVSVINHPDASQMSRTREECWEISSSYSIVKPLVAIIQLFSGCLTLYRTQGDQLKQYGYSAFGLTVTPYVTMSFINLCGALLTPSYSHMYLVSTAIMNEAQKRTEADFGGVVGTASVPENSNSGEDESFSGGFTGIFEVNTEGEVRLRLYRPNSGLQDVDHDAIAGLDSRHVIQNHNFQQDFAVVKFTDEMYAAPFSSLLHSTLVFKSERSQLSSASLPILEIPEIPAFQRPEPSRKDKFYGSISILIMIIIGCIPIAVVGGFSHFEPGNSLPFQRGWIMAWFTAGIGVGLFSLQQAFTDGTWIWRYRLLSLLLSLVVFSMIYAPGIGGFIVVGKMISEYGSCSLIS